MKTYAIVDQRLDGDVFTKDFATLGQAIGEAEMVWTHMTEEERAESDFRIMATEAYDEDFVPVWEEGDVVWMPSECYTDDGLWEAYEAAPAVPVSPAHTAVIEALVDEMDRRLQRHGLTALMEPDVLAGFFRDWCGGRLECVREAEPEHRSHVGGMTVDNPDEWYLRVFRGSEETYRFWTHVPDWEDPEQIDWDDEVEVEVEPY